jgi:hypothetical protein
MTADTPESVVAFYTEHLRNQEWREMDRGMDKNGFCQGQV